MLISSPVPVASSVRKRVSISTPSKSFLVMKFTTPATASEPYSAEEPSFTISMRSTIICGIIELMSTVESPRGATNAGKCRRPFTNGSVAASPKLRRLMGNRPWKPPPVKVAA